MSNNVGAGQPVKVFVVAPAMVRWGLEKLLLDAAQHVQLAGSAASLAEAEHALRACAADVLVLDLDAGYGIAALEELRLPGHTRWLAVTSSSDAAMLDRVVLAGARGVVRKSDPPASLPKAVQCVHAGQLWLDRGAAGRIFVELVRCIPARQSDPDHARIATLTARERQMIMAVASDTGAPGKVIAGRLRISEHTLRNHLSAIYGKLGVANRVDLYAYATKHRLDKAR